MTNGFWSEKKQKPPNTVWIFAPSDGNWAKLIKTMVESTNFRMPLGGFPTRLLGRVTFSGPCSAPALTVIRRTSGKFWILLYLTN